MGKISSTGFQRLSYICIFLLFFFLSIMINANTILCPGNEKVTKMMDKAISLNTDGKSKEAIDVLQKIVNLSRSIGCEKGELVATKNMMLVFSQTYDYKKALEISDRVRDLALNQKNYKILSTLYGTRATLYENLGLNEESLKEYEKALKYAMLIPNADTRYYEVSLIYYNLTPFYQGRDNGKVLYYLEKSKEEVQKVSDNNEEVSLNKKLDMLISVNMNLGIYYRDSKNKNKDIKLSEFYFMEALRQLDNSKGEINPDTKIDLYQALQEFYQEKKDYKKAIGYGEDMLVMERSNSMPYNRRVAYMVLAKSYLGIGDSRTSKKYLDLFTKLNDSILTIEKEAVEAPVKKIISENKTDGEKRIKNIISISSGILMFFIVIIIGMLFYRKRSNMIVHKKYEQIIEQLKKGTIQNIRQVPSSVQNNISSDTERKILSKLEEFEASGKFLEKDVTLGFLANQFGTNTKYLSEVINKNRSQKFSNYINSLRIDYIVHKLYNEPKYREYKISYLAEESGFASPQVFIMAFKKVYDVTPFYFIQNLKKDQI
ncbi:AraC-like DNA-binding protein [Epilithonimonas hungarica]|uniref:helix-turn-helix domain-containing protein n=1 Tax=Epilithonimonas hungarica TaxID=454006 RepID=UPI00277D21D9|nr:helix-turn-helix domain-containing protein [Epilithonimonas hungarica]MDP9958043.1 AraC-like DNA-binding protein [Epilithonimonas hungarica]